jgi:hypothetical protein
MGLQKTFFYNVITAIINTQNRISIIYFIFDINFNFNIILSKD